MTDDQKVIIAMAMDLKRVALGYYNGSKNTAMRFYDEVLKRKSEIDENNLKPYLKNILEKLPGLINQSDDKKVADDALMYSTIFQNYALHG